MKLKIKIKDNKVYLIRWMFFKVQIGIYDNGFILLQNSSLVKKLNETNDKSIGIFRKMF